MTTFGLEVTPDWKTFLKFIQICRIGCPFGWSEPIFAQLMTCNSWQTNKTKVLWKRCLPRADPKNFEQRGEVFCSRSLGNPTLECCIEFSKISENKSWIVEKVNSVATSNFKRIFLLHKQIYFAQALKSPKKILTRTNLYWLVLNPILSWVVVVGRPTRYI